MTICCGWITPESAYLVADSVVTETNPALMTIVARPDTSFGEPTITEPGKAVYEGCIKIVQLGTDCVAAMTGDLQLATAALRAIHGRLGQGESILEALDRERERADGSFRLLIAGHENQAPRLWHVADQRIQEHYEVGAMLVLGSAVQDPAHMKWMRSVLGRSVIGSPDRMLAAVLAGSQLRGQIKNAMELGVGGAYFGGHVTAGIATLSRNILYVFVDQPIEPSLSTPRAVLTGWWSGLAFTRVFTSAAEGHEERFMFMGSDIPPIPPDALPGISQSLKKAEVRPQTVVLVDQASGSYALIDAGLRPDLVRVLITEHTLELEVHTHAVQIADGLFAEARRRSLPGFVQMAKGFPPDVPPDGRWRLVSEPPTS